LFINFVTNILYAKKGMAKPGSELLARAERDTFISLTRDSIPVYQDIKNEQGTKDIVHALKRTVHALFGGMTNPFDEEIKPFFPSTSANYINSRGLGGAVGAILEHPDLLCNLKTDEDLVVFKEVQTLDGVKLEVDTRKLDANFNILMKNLRKYAIDERPVAVPVPLAEALKVRVITKGPPLRMTYMKVLQRAMWNRLASFPCMSLLANPVVTDELLMKMFPQNKGKFLSVDYSDATNQLFSWCSNIVVDQICECLKLDLDQVQMFFESMTYHELEYKSLDPNWSQKHPKPGVNKWFTWSARQTNGQLMGSITSFPILCIINLSICRMVMEMDHGVKYSLREVPLLINGDDGLFQASDRGYDLWKHYATLCGLKPSVGKVYFSDSFLNINSTTFTIKDNVFKHIPYVNMGLLNNIKRSGGDESTSFMSIGAKCTKLVEGSPPELQERVLGQYIHLHSFQKLDKNGNPKGPVPFLKQVGVPWFIPEYLNGLGLPIVGDFKPSEYNLRFLKEASEMRRPKKPVSAWKCWSYAISRLPELAQALKISAKSLTPLEYSTYEPNPGSDKSLDDICGQLVVEALFRNQGGLKDLYTKPDECVLSILEAKYYRQLRSNWKKILCNGNRSKVRTVESLESYLRPHKVGRLKLFESYKEFEGISVCPLTNDILYGDPDDDMFMPIF